MNLGMRIYLYDMNSFYYKNLNKASAGWREQSACCWLYCMSLPGEKHLNITA